MEEITKLIIEPLFNGIYLGNKMFLEALKSAPILVVLFILSLIRKK